MPDESPNALSSLLNAVTLLVAQIATDVVDAMFVLIVPRDRDTANHCKAVGMLAARLGNSLSLGGECADELQLAGRAHDIGKLEWPDASFGDKTLPELHNVADQMYYHPTRAKVFLCSALKSITRQGCPCGFRWIEWVWFHHWGYTDDYQEDPAKEDEEVKQVLECRNGCKEKDLVELGIAVLNVSDAFHAAISKRLYKGRTAEAKSINEVLFEIQEGSRTRYHPDVVQALSDNERWLRQVFLPHIEQ